jgi:hypothetical protein
MGCCLGWELAEGPSEQKETAEPKSWRLSLKGHPLLRELVVMYSR